MSVSLPSAFLSSMRSLLGEARFYLFMAEMQRPANAFLRLNEGKTPQEQPLPTPPRGRETSSERLQEHVSSPLWGGREGASAPHSVPWCATGYAYTERPEFTFDPLMHAGGYYVQEQSSMFLAHVLRSLVHEPVLMIDLCAAPGGKSTLARQYLPEGSVLLSNEFVRQRAQILAENVQKWGHSGVLVTNNSAADYRRSGLEADVLLLDVPCSGEGMFRKDPENIGEWSPRKVEECQQLQRSIVADAWECLKPGGLIIYSTCTFNTAENEENVRWICSELGAEAIDLNVPEAWPVCGSLLEGFTEPVYRFVPGLPSQHENLQCRDVACYVSTDNHAPSHSETLFGEGLFMAVLRKKGNDSHFDTIPLGVKRGQVKYSNLTLLDRPEDYVEVQEGDLGVAIPTYLYNIYARVRERLRLVHAGIPLGQMKGKAFVPHQALALSTSLRPDAFPRVELSWAEAIQYLRRESLVLPQEAPRGIVVVTYAGLPLGFAKNLGNRANNLYPQEWRIRTTHIPASPLLPQLVNTTH